MKHASRRMRDRARALRRNETLSEHRLWGWLRNRTFAGRKFRRQVPIGRYIVDFYCPELKLVIEVDGKQHETVREHDEIRSEYLEDPGIKVVRITNEMLAKESPIVDEIVRFAIER